MNLNDINDNCPTFPRPYEGPFDVTEGQPGPRVWTFLAHDGDSGPSGQVEYSIVAGDPLGEWGQGASPLLLAAPWRSWACRGEHRVEALQKSHPPSQLSLSTTGNPVLSNRKLNLFVPGQGVAGACGGKGKIC